MATKPNTQQRLLKKFRKDFDISLAELAKEAKLSEAMLSRFEAGNRKLSPEAWTRVRSTIQRLLAEDEARRKTERAKAEQTAEKLGVPFTGLFGVDPQSPESRRRLEEAALWLAKSEGLTLSESLRREAERLAQAKLGSSATGEALREELTEHLIQQALEYAEKVTRERDQLKARVAELEQELARERANKAGESSG